MGLGSFQPQSLEPSWPREHSPAGQRGDHIAGGERGCRVWAELTLDPVTDLKQREVR
jgi:hypothetical protein